MLESIVKTIDYGKIRDFVTDYNSRIHLQFYNKQSNLPRKFSISASLSSEIVRNKEHLNQFIEETIRDYNLNTKNLYARVRFRGKRKDFRIYG